MQTHRHTSLSKQTTLDMRQETFIIARPILLVIGIHTTDEYCIRTYHENMVVDGTGIRNVKRKYLNTC